MLITNKLFNKSRAVVTVLVSLYVLMYTASVQALPSFARQTGEACTACHIQAYGQSLTPRGRDFKLKGYAEGDASRLPPLSLIVEGGGTLDVADRKEPFSYIDNSHSYFSGSLFYAGKIVDHLGAYVQGSYALDPESGRDVGFLDKVDMRFANQVDLSDHHIDYGVTVNNEPGVQDLWNTNAVWGTSALPFLHSLSDFNLVPLADRGLSGNVAGSSLYALINKTLYLEAGGYASLPGDVQKGIARDNNGFNPQIDGSAAYWRVALQHQWGGHYVSLGHFGLRTDTTKNPDNPLYSLGVLNGGVLFSANYPAYSDLGLDATYQYLADQDHIFEFKGRYMRETRTESRPDFLMFPYALQSVKRDSTTESFNLNGSYIWEQTLGLSVGYHQYSFPSQYSRWVEDIEYFSTGLSYTPFGKQHSFAAPWANLRLSIDYVTDITRYKFPAPSNDNLYLTGRLAF